MHNLRYLSFDATQALLVVGSGIVAIAALLLFESLAARHVRERTQRAVAAAALVTARVTARVTSAPPNPQRDQEIT